MLGILVEITALSTYYSYFRADTEEENLEYRITQRERQRDDDRGQYREMMAYIHLRT